MLSLNGVSAWIEVDGKKLEQYGVEEDLDQRRVACWIPTQVDKGFSVVFKDDLEYREHSLSSRLQIDGSVIPGWVLLPTAKCKGRIMHQSDQSLSATSSRPFLFSKLELTDQDEHLDQASPHLGEIQIHIHRVQVLGTRLYEPRPGVSAHGRIHERSKKAVTQCVSYGMEVKTESRYTCSSRHLDNGTPLVTFVFKYRDLDFLQAAGIAPRVLQTKKKRSTISGDVLDLATGGDVKSESDDPDITIIDNPLFPPGRSNAGRDSDPRPTKRIKREKKPVPAGEVIDLT